MLKISHQCKMDPVLAITSTFMVLASKFSQPGATLGQINFVKIPIFQSLLIIFTMYLYLRNIEISISLGIMYIFIQDFLMNDVSKLCIFPDHIINGGESEVNSYWNLLLKKYKK